MRFLVKVIMITEGLTVICDRCGGGFSASKISRLTLFDVMVDESRQTFENLGFYCIKCSKELKIAIAGTINEETNR